eukprot:g42530.t1
MKSRTWNIRTLMDSPASDRLECRTAVVARELRSYNVETTTLIPTRGEGSVINLSVLECIPLHATRYKLSNTPALPEVEKAICQLKNNKAAGADGIPAKAWKCRGKELLLQRHTLVCLIWKVESVPGQLRDATVMRIFKKGDKSGCTLRSVLLYFGCTMKSVTILHLLYNDMEVVVIKNGSATDPFPVRFLEFVLSAKAVIDEEIQHRLQCTSAAFGCLRKRVLEDNNIRSDTKVMVYRAVVVPPLSYVALRCAF